MFRLKRGSAPPGSTHHVLEHGDLPADLRHHVVPRRLPAVQLRLVGLGPPDVGRPPDAGQQPGGATHRVVAGPGGLFVPGLDWVPGDEQRHPDANHGEPHRALHV